MREVDDLVVPAGGVLEQHTGAYKFLRAEADEFHDRLPAQATR
jgi:hypothetical protein